METQLGLLPLLTQWHVGPNGCMFLVLEFFSPSPFPLSFHLIMLCDYFFICFILFVWWVLKGKKKWTQSCSWILGVCLGWGREHGEKSFFKKKKEQKKQQTWTCVKSCIIYEICIKEQCTSGTINNYSIFESVLLNNVIFPSWEENVPYVAALSWVSSISFCLGCVFLTDLTSLRPWWCR